MCFQYGNRRFIYKVTRSGNPSEPPFDELLEQLKSELPEPLFATVSKKFLALQYAELKIQVLEERLRLKRIQMYGPGSEKLTNEQLESDTPRRAGGLVSGAASKAVV